MSTLNLHILCVAAYNVLGVPSDDPERLETGGAFLPSDANSVFWVGVRDIFVRGNKRTVGSYAALGLPPGSIGVVQSVELGVGGRVAYTQLNASVGTNRIALNPSLMT